MKKKFRRFFPFFLSFLFFSLFLFFVFFNLIPLAAQNVQSLPGQKNLDFAEILEKGQKSESKDENSENGGKDSSGENKDENKGEKYNSALVEIPAGANSLFTRVYFFNTAEEGGKIASEIFQIEDFERFSGVEFKKLRMIVPGDKISAFNYGMFKSFREFWILKNEGDGWLYGKGFFLD